jgi:2-methylcitrate dehydratase PrpD
VSGPTILEELAQFATETTFDSLPATVAHSVEQRLLDTLGVAVAASAQGTADGVAEIVAETGGAPESTLIGRRARGPAAMAALHNGTLAHSLDFDDTHLPSVLHPSASIIPTALALAEATSAPGLAVIAAIAVGVEVTVRTGMGGYLEKEGNIFFERGWHATSICGTLGSAAAAAKLFGLDAAGIASAIGIATSLGSGVIEANRMGGTVKRIHCGWAAHAGILAAQLARHGFTAPATAFEGRFGFYRAFTDGHYDRDAVVGELGTRWEILATHFKPYPANHYTHAGIDAALAIRARTAFDPEDVVAIELGSSEPALRTIGEPREAKIRPVSGYHAKFSGPFAVAAALLGRGGGLGVDFDDFTDERARDPRYLALAAKVRTFVDPACDAAFPRAFGAVLRVHLRSGAVLEERVMDNRGGPKRPLSDAELRTKFTSNTAGVLGARGSDALADAIFGIARDADIAALMAKLAVQPLLLSSRSAERGVAS